MGDRVAALYVEVGGVYYGLDDVEPWGLPDRDAREYAGPWPVVAHPPCARWCRLAGLAEHKHGIPRGEDGGVFAAALESVRRWGGVLEHPAWSAAWKAHGLIEPLPRGWTVAGDGQGWTCQVAQGHYGHRAAKPTWLYAINVDLPSLRWGVSDKRAEWGINAPTVERMPKWERKATPLPFRDLLLDMARSAAHG